nr:PREDICTED: uncharacterized protein LOC108203795 [Daucus carota subsp. sativus]
MSEIWINLPRFSEEYSKGVKDFVENAMVHYAVENEMKCPCSLCKSKQWWGAEQVEKALSVEDWKSHTDYDGYEETDRQISWFWEEEKDIFCSVLRNAKLPYGFSSNISKCVQDRKVAGYKSHDAHIIMQGWIVKKMSGWIVLFFSLLYGSEKALSVEDWKSHTDYDGYEETDRQISWFWEVKKGAGVGVGKDAEEVKKGANLGEVVADKVKGKKEVKGVNEYEKRRNKNIEENEKKFQELGLRRHSAGTPVQKKPNNRKAFSDDKESDNYDPKNDSDQSSDNEEDMAISKRKKKAGKSVLGSGPRTRSRASRIVLPPPVKQVNDAVEVEVNKEVEANDDTPKVSTVERLKLMRTNAPGSMAAYLQLREQEKMQAALETTQQSQSLTENLQQPGTPPGQPEEEEKQRKPRGKSKLTHVHTRGEKREIKLSDLGQPVDDDEHLIREFSNFLGTTVREFVSLTCRSWTEVPQKDILWEYVKDKYVIPEEGYDWVMTTMRDLFRGYKARIKRDYYYKYQTDEERLENRPREVPLKDFKILLEYWADEKIAKKARTNSESRRLITETHTAGSRSFAQISHNMALERALKATREQPPAPISDADVYVKTRKRESTRTYKLPTEVVEKKVENVKKLLKDGTIDEADEVVYGGKDHSRTFLVGRLIEKREPKKKIARPLPTIPEKYVASLTEQIRDQIAKEMEEQVQKKVEDNVKLMMSKLAEKNPGLNLDIELTSATEPTVEPSQANNGSD